MPQFDLANWLPQIVWLIVLFGAMYLVVRAALPKVEAVTAARGKVIGDDLGRAEAAKAEAAAKIADSEAKLAAARDAAGKAVADTKVGIAADTAARLKTVDAGLATKAEAAQAALGEAHAKALANLQTVAVDATTDIVERLTGKRVDDSAAAKAVAAVAG
jgi:F-type H+-transporting ATPase subunit b